MEVVEIQEAVPVVGDRLPDADRQLNRSSVTSRIKSFFMAAVVYFTVMLSARRDEDEARRAVEPDNNETRVSDEEEAVCVVVDQSTATDLRPEQSAVSSDYKSVIQVTVALAFASGSFGVMYAVPGGVNEMGSAVMGDTIGFIVFLVTDMIAFLASLLIAMIVAAVSEISPKMDYMIRMSLWAAGVSLILTFLAAAYVVVLPKHKWVVLLFGGVVSIALALLLLYHLSTILHQVSRTSIRENTGMHFPDGLEGGHVSRARRGGQLIKRRKI